MTRILNIDGDPVWFDYLKAALETPILNGIVEVVDATSCEEAKSIFAADKSFGAIIIDCRMASGEEIVDLVRHFGEKCQFLGPILVTSLYPDIQEAVFAQEGIYVREKKNIGKKVCVALGIPLP